MEKGDSKRQVHWQLPLQHCVAGRKTCIKLLAETEKDVVFGIIKIVCSENIKYKNKPKVLQLSWNKNGIILSPVSNLPFESIRTGTLVSTLAQEYMWT